MKLPLSTRKFCNEGQKWTKSDSDSKPRPGGEALRHPFFGHFLS